MKFCLTNYLSFAVKTIFYTLLFICNCFEQTKGSDFSALRAYELLGPNGEYRYNTIDGHKHFIGPNELYVQLAEPLLETIQEGALVGVGALRLFFMAALSDRVTKVISIDTDPMVTFFVELMAEVLSTSKDRNHLNTLWFNLENFYNDLDIPVSMDCLNLWSFCFSRSSWTPHYYNTSALLDFLRFPSRFSNFNPTPLAKGNFFQDDEAYVRLKKLADEKNIIAKTLNVSDSTQVENFFSEHPGLSISWLDLSNAHYSEFLDKEPAAWAVLNFIKGLREHSKIVFTDWQSHPFMGKADFDDRFGEINVYGAINTSFLKFSDINQMVQHIVCALEEFQKDIKNKISYEAFPKNYPKEH